VLYSTKGESVSPLTDARKTRLIESEFTGQELVRKDFTLFASPFEGGGRHSVST